MGQHCPTQSEGCLLSTASVWLQHWLHFRMKHQVSILINPDVGINKMKAGLDEKRGGDETDFRMVTQIWATHVLRQGNQARFHIMKSQLAVFNWTRLSWEGFQVMRPVFTAGGCKTQRSKEMHMLEMWFWRVCGRCLDIVKVLKISPISPNRAVRLFGEISSLNHTPCLNCTKPEYYEEKPKF